MVARYSIDAFLTYRCFDRGGVWLADQPHGLDSYCLGFLCQPVRFAGHAVQQGLARLLMDLPVGAVLQSICFADPDIAADLATWGRARQALDTHPLLDLTAARAQYFQAWAEQTTLPASPYRMQPRLFRHFLFMRLPGALSTPSAAAYKAFKQDTLAVQVQHIQAALSATGMQVQRLTGGQCVSWLGRLANPWFSGDSRAHDAACQADNGKRDVPKFFGPEVTLRISEQGDIGFTHLQTGKQQWCRPMTVMQYPAGPHALSAMAECLGSNTQVHRAMPGWFFTYTTCARIATDKTRTLATKKMAMLQYQTQSSQPFWQQVMRPLYARRQNIEALFQALEGEDTAPIKVMSGIVVGADSPNTLLAQQRIAQTLWQQQGFDLQAEAMISLPVWLSSLPGQYRPEQDEPGLGLDRGTTLTATQAATLCFVQNDWPGAGVNSGGVLLLSRRGGLASVDLFATAKSNFNAVMAAQSGSGKSFLANEFILDVLLRGGRVFVIDAGHSYAPLVKLMQGHLIALQPDSGFCLNPFSGITSQAELHQALSTLLPVLVSMAFPKSANLTAHPEPHQHRLLEATLLAVWQQHGISMTVQHIAEALLASTDQEARRLGQQLQPWAVGRYAAYVAGKDTVSVSAALTVLELDGLAAEPELQAIVLQLLLLKIERSLYHTGETVTTARPPTLVVLDEAWSLLQQPDSAVFIERAFRRARKYHCAMLLITQALTDCISTPTGRAALANANWLLLLPHDPGSLQQALDGGWVQMPPWVRQQVQRLHKTEAYTEVYVHNQAADEAGVYRFVVDPSSYWSYTNDPSDRRKLANLQAQGNSLTAAIQTLASAHKDTDPAGQSGQSA